MTDITCNEESAAAAATDEVKKNIKSKAKKKGRPAPEVKPDTPPEVEAAQEDEDIKSILEIPQLTPDDVSPVGLFTSLVPEQSESEANNNDDEEEDEDEFAWMHQIAYNDKGAIAKTMYNVNLILTNDKRIKGVLAHNDFTHTICQIKSIKSGLAGTGDLILEDAVNGDSLDDKQVDVVRAILSAPPDMKGYGAAITENDVRAGMREISRQNKFHPVKRYLERQVWDKVSRIDGLFVNTFGADDNAYTREVAFKMMVAAVTRIYEPGHKFDFIPVLESYVQGFGKSTAVRALAAGFFAELYGEDLADTTRAREKMSGAWILEVPELTAMRGRDAGKMKAFLSAEVDKARMAYDRTATEVKRQAIFIGTIDRSEYLDDPAGNRRYWPIKCGSTPIDLDKFKREVPQLWAEAVQMYRDMREVWPNGDMPLYLEKPESILISKKMQKSRMVTSVDEGWKDDIAEIAGVIQDFHEPIFCDKMFERIEMGNGFDGMRLKVFSLRYMWTRLGMNADDYQDTRNQNKFAAVIAHIPGIEKGYSPSKLNIASYCSDACDPTDEKYSRYYVINHDILKTHR